jgi:hypothetical protein
MAILYPGVPVKDKPSLNELAVVDGRRALPSRRLREPGRYPREYVIEPLPATPQDLCRAARPPHVLPAAMSAEAMPSPRDGNAGQPAPPARSVLMSDVG